MITRGSRTSPTLMQLARTNRAILRRAGHGERSARENGRARGTEETENILGRECTAQKRGAAGSEGKEKKQPRRTFARHERRALSRAPKREHIDRTTRRRAISLAYP